MGICCIPKYIIPKYHTNSIPYGMQFQPLFFVFLGAVAPIFSYIIILYNGVKISCGTICYVIPHKLMHTLSMCAAACN